MTSRENTSYQAVQDSVRLLALRATRLLDTGPEEAFDRYTRLARKVIDAPVSLVSLVDMDRQYFKSQQGLPEPWASERQTPLSHCFCQHVVNSGQAVVVSDARQDERVSENLAITDLNVIAYLGVPLATREGQVLGALNVIDSRPREWTEGERELLAELAAGVISEIEIRMLADRFMDTFMDMRELESERDRMNQMLVHDLRNPLSSMMAGLDMLAARSSLDSREQQWLERVRCGSQTLLEMINGLLEEGRQDAEGAAGGVRPYSDIAVPALLGAACDQMAQLAAGRGLRLDRRLDTAIPSVRGDRASLERVVVNLLGNAIRHTPSGGAVEVSARRLDGSAVEIAVTDTGEGIPPGDQQRIFERFARLHEFAEGQGVGGLGLAYCREVVDAHGGAIRVDSEPGRGSVFRFTLPIPRADSAPPDPQQAPLP